MSELLAQVIFAARNDDFENWVQILIFVIVAVFYVLGSILKVKAKKVEGQQKELQLRQPQPGRPVVRVQHRRAQPQREKTMLAQPITQKVRAETERAALGRVVEPTLQPKFQMPTPQLETKISELPEIRIRPGLQELPEFTSGAVKALNAEGVTPVSDFGELGRAEQIPEVEVLPEDILNYSDPEQLRRAILHYEILGRPLAVRDFEE